jgi:integrase
MNEHVEQQTVPLQSKRSKRRGRWRDGTIEEVGKDRWRLRYRINGQRYSVTIAAEGRSEAAKELRALLKAGDDGTHTKRTKLTLDDWAKEWIAGRPGNERTRERYEGLLRNQVLPTLGSRKLQSLEPSDLDKLYRSLLDGGLSPRTVRHVHVVLSGCLKTAVKKKKLGANPAADADKPRAPDSTAARVLDGKELGALVAGFRGHPLHGIVAVAVWTGARRNEILALRWSDINFAAKTMRIERSAEETKAFGRRTKETKTGARGCRTIAVDDGLLAVLSEIRESHLRVVAGIPDGASADLSLVKLPEGALIFPAPGDDLTALRDVNAVTRTFERQAAALGFGHLRFHDLRGSHETMLLDAGVPVHTVAARCGHDPAMLLRAYAKRTAGSDAKAAAIIGELAQNAARGL